MRREEAWPWVLGIAIGGMLDSLYLLLYQTGKVKRLVCPFFGEGCDQVVGSSAAYPGGIPDAIFGVAAYTAAAATAAAIPRATGRTKRALAAAAIGGSAGAIGLSAYLTYAQPKRAGAWCFWCLLSAGLSASIAAIAIPGALAILREERED